MIRNVVVTYTVKPEAMDEHIRLIRGVFDQLTVEQPEDVEYKVLRLTDGETFVHVSTSDTPDGSNPLTSMSAFQEFNRDIADRVATQPRPAGAEIVGTYTPATAISELG